MARTLQALSAVTTIRQRRMKRRGATGAEQVSVVLCVALAGLAGMRVVGGSFRDTIGTQGRGDLWGMLSSSQAAAGPVCAVGPQVPGIDVSHHQDTINWDAVKASGVQYAFVRVSDGTRNPDAQFDRNWAEAARVGIMRGAYQYFRPGEDPIAQAKLFVERVGPMGPNDLPPVIDIEGGGNEHVPGPQVVEAALQWVQYVERATGKRPIIYTGHYYWKDTVAENAAFKDFPLWVPNYSKDCPLVPDPWQGWTFFQHTSSGAVPGIDGGVDMNLFNGDLVALSDFAKNANIQSQIPADAIPAEAAAPAAPVEAQPPPAEDPAQVSVLALRTRPPVGIPSGPRRGLSIADFRTGFERRPGAWLTATANGLRRVANATNLFESVEDVVSTSAKETTASVVAEAVPEARSANTSHDAAQTIPTPGGEATIGPDTAKSSTPKAGVPARVRETGPVTAVAGMGDPAMTRPEVRSPIGAPTGKVHDVVTSARPTTTDADIRLRVAATAHAATPVTAHP